MIIEKILVYMIVILGVFNLLRMAMFMIGADIYDLRKSRAAKRRLKSNDDTDRSLALIVNALLLYKQDQKVAKQRAYQPLVSVIIPAHNEEKVVTRCLDSVFANDYGRFEVIVVNDGSTDSTQNKLRYYKRTHPGSKLTISYQQNQGKAVAINNGVKKFAHGSLIMVLDADSLIATDSIRHGVAHFEDKTVVAAAANIKILDDGSLLGLVQKFEYIIAYRMKRALTVLNIEYIIGGIGSMFRREVLRQNNYYDTNTVTEDIDFTMKVLSKGNKAQRVIYSSDVRAYSESVPSVSGLIRQRYRWKYGRFQTFIKHRFMFFSTDPIYDKRLTFYQLPLALFLEFTFLLEPIIVGFIFFISIRYGDTKTLFSAYLVITSYIALNVLGEETFSIKERLKLLVLTPILYFLFFVLSFVEYTALAKCIIHYRELKNSLANGDCRWEHVSRTGKAVTLA